MRYRYLSLLLCAALALTMLVVCPQEAEAAAGDVVLASCSSAGVENSDVNQHPDISAGGRYVVFDSTAANLGPSVHAGRRHVYRKDAASGEVLLCSSASDGTEGNGSLNDRPCVSADGTYVFFRSNSTNLIPGHPTAAGRDHVFRKDLVTGEVMLCSSNPDGSEGNGDSVIPSSSADGRYVAFGSIASNLLASGTTSNWQVFRKDLVTGGVGLVSSTEAGVQGNSFAQNPAMNGDGRFIAFSSPSTNLVSGITTSGRQVFRKDLVTGGVELASCTPEGVQGNQDSDYPDISVDGRFIAFRSTAGNLVSGVTPGRGHVYRKDLRNLQTRLCSSAASGAEGNNHSYYPSISADGTYVSFSSYATNLSPQATDANLDILRRSMLLNGGVDCCSVSASGQEGDGVSNYSRLSADGGFVAFDSLAHNLIDGNPTNGSQVFRKELPCATDFFFAEGYTGTGFQEYLCLGNPGVDDIDVTVSYYIKDEVPQTVSFPVPAGSRLTVDVNSAIGTGKEVSIKAFSLGEFAAERPIYFDYGAGWTGGHDVLGAPYPNTSWYFAEGYTGAGFDEYVCVLNPSSGTAELEFRFQTKQAGEVVKSGYSVGGNTRATFNVNEILGAGFESSLLLQSDLPVVAERPMYFDYLGPTGTRHWNGGHCVMGADYLKREYYFAEGYTGTGFDEYLTLQNPNPLAIEVDAVYQFGGEIPPQGESYSVPAGTRWTVYVPDEVGADRNVSVKLTCDFPFLAERPMYFSYGQGWTGGHCTIGASFRRSDLFFAEGYTGEGFEEWLCIQNPSASASHVRIHYYTQEAGPLAPHDMDIPASSRVTVNVNEQAGPGYQLSSRVEVLSGSWIIVERPMYFNFNGWTGGHDVVGYGL